MRTVLRCVRLSSALLFFLACSLQAQTSTTSWSVDMLDQILASVPSGTNLAQVGDMQILVSNLQFWRDELAGARPPSAFDGSAPTWPGGTVYYTFDVSVTALHQRAFLDAANEWATFALLQFVPRTTQANYVTVQEVSSLEGGQSAVGMVGGQQFLSISPNAWNRPTLCHELGHTLGLVHEHQRSDRDSFVQVFTNNIQSGEIGNFVLLPNSLNQGAYDFLSVMHYNRNSFAVNTNLDTLEPLPAYLQYLDIMGQQFDPVLSAADRAGMAALYGAGPVVTCVVTNTLDSGPGSLRAALYYGFDHPGTTVTFNIPTADPGYSNNVFNIQPTDRFPSLVHATAVDGTSEPTSNPNGPAILLSGALAQSPSVLANGLRILGSGCIVHSLIINGFNESGILINGSAATGNAVLGCYLGLDATGTLAVTNGFSPLTLANGASGNTIGGLSASARNVLSGSHYQGLVLRDAGTTRNVVEGNYIGLNAAGTAALPNAWSGVAIFNGAQSNVIGGTIAAARNIISGNGEQGLTISGPGASGNFVEGNYIGLDPTGTVAIPNAWAGVNCFGGASGNVIGGSMAGAGNVISGNTLQGVLLQDAGTDGNLVQGNFIGLNPGGTAAIANGWSGVDIYNGAQGNLVGGTASGAANVISGNGNYGVSLSAPGASGNLVEGNYIGVNPSGFAAIPNAWSGVGIFNGAQSNVIGGTRPGTGNLISGNANYGVAVSGTNTSNNVIVGNLIGPNAASTGPLPNSWSGVIVFQGASATTVGGTVAGAGNVISGNGNHGMVLYGAGTMNNLVAGNLVGLNAAGTSRMGNGWSGVAVYGQAQGNLVGGTVPAARNVVAGNGNYGVFLSDTNTLGNTVAGNYIGLDATGSYAISNTWRGVAIFGGAGTNLIGGGVGARNLISGNGQDGVTISGYSMGNRVQGNTVGLNVAGAAVPNALGGVTLFTGAQANQIGGTALGQANLIGYNLSDGVRLFDAPTSNNVVRGNSIFGNSGAGIALYGTANNSFNPISLTLTSAVMTTSLTVGGTLYGPPNTTFHLDFYANPPPDGTAQAQYWLGSRDLVTGVGAFVAFSLNLGAVVPVGNVITATGTDPAGNTSQLAAGIAVSATDSVGDGIPDAWRLAHFGAGTTTNNLSCATCDPDHDGLNNRQEFLAGTDPNNASSVLRISGPTVSGADVTVSFQSVSGIVYRLDNRPAIATGAWGVLEDQLPGTGGLIQVTQPGAATLPAGFYRVDVLP